MLLPPPGRSPATLPEPQPGIMRTARRFGVSGGPVPMAKDRVGHRTGDDRKPVGNHPVSQGCQHGPGSAHPRQPERGGQPRLHEPQASRSDGDDPQDLRDDVGQEHERRARVRPGGAKRGEQRQVVEQRSPDRGGQGLAPPRPKVVSDQVPLGYQPEREVRPISMTSLPPPKDAFDSFSSTGIPLRMAGMLSTGRAKVVAVVSKDTVVSPTAVDAPSSPPTVSMRYWSAAPAGAPPGTIRLNAFPASCDVTTRNHPSLRSAIR